MHCLCLFAAVRHRSARTSDRIYIRVRLHDARLLRTLREMPGPTNDARYPESTNFVAFVEFYVPWIGGSRSNPFIKLLERELTRFLFSPPPSPPRRVLSLERATKLTRTLKFLPRHLYAFHSPPLPPFFFYSTRRTISRSWQRCKIASTYDCPHSSICPITAAFDRFRIK